jgi:EAL domain-containing protein (putative c-di-GMP-specific phosphodiesterase class I)
VNLASAFNLTSIAEGVETTDQLELLRSLNCDQSQGYLHSRPVPAQQLEALLARQRAALLTAASARSMGV